ncbi:hypothetical protein Pcinc_042623 [Petrolisthes cinctipes]|uniref:Uncharacterized protein n=1 Tax=Petrolisthes cinctipes TaxID=88211 RepID=A0AAE1BH44_PETCI|nr:hypothetical protein Pcinc_042623 [Petrolisthes cinctipes]
MFVDGMVLLLPRLSVPAVQSPSSPESQQSRVPAVQSPSSPESQQSRVPAVQSTGDRSRVDAGTHKRHTNLSVAPAGQTQEAQCCVVGACVRSRAGGGGGGATTGSRHHQGRQGGSMLGGGGG